MEPERKECWTCEGRGWLDDLDNDGAAISCEDCGGKGWGWVDRDCDEDFCPHGRHLRAPCGDCTVDRFGQNDPWPQGN